MPVIRVTLHHGCRILFAFCLVVVHGLLLPQYGWAQAALENPQPASDQSGIGVISGWVCDANLVEIEIDGMATLQAAYGTSREDTRGACGDANNGFGLLINWNLIQEGVHTIRALADGVEFGNVTFKVRTLGLGEFPRGLAGEFTIPDFPEAGDESILKWEETLQNFVLTSGMTSSSSGSGSGTGQLENPAPGSSLSGIGVISGWVCDANLVEVEIDGGPRLDVAYGTSREDTRSVCGDADNGFGLLINWNLVGEGVHTIRAFADGVEFARAEFVVATLGAEIRTGLSQLAIFKDFPMGDTDILVRWQESQQNFALVGVLPPGSDPSLCVTQEGVVRDAFGQEALFQVTNVCPLNGDTLARLYPIRRRSRRRRLSARRRRAGVLSSRAAPRTWENGRHSTIRGGPGQWHQ